MSPDARKAWAKVREITLLCEVNGQAHREAILRLERTIEEKRQSISILNEKQAALQAESRQAFNSARALDRISNG